MVGSTVGALWGYESTILRNPNATNGEKLFGTVLGGVTGWLMPGMAIGQAFGGAYGLVTAVDRNLPQEYVLAEMSKGEVIGGIAGGAMQGIAMGGLLGGLDDGIMAGLSSVLMDAGAAYLGYEMASAIGMDPWEGANIGMTLSGFARLAIGGMKSMASRKTGQSLTEEVRFEASSGQGVREHGRLAGVNRQLNLKEGKTYRGQMDDVLTSKRQVAAERERTGRGRDEGTGGRVREDTTNPQPERMTQPDAYQLAKQEECKAFEMVRDADGRLRIIESCFAAGTPLRTPEGSKFIEDFVPGDLVLSRSEYQPNGLIVAKSVDAVFQRVAPILHVHVGGQVIRTTSEHPFFVHNRGWLRAGDLAAGDRLLTEDSRWTAVAEVFDTGEWEPVYNLRVTDFHTYFVGSDRWNFAVWAHNRYDMDRIEARALWNDFQVYAKRTGLSRDEKAFVWGLIRSEFKHGGQNNTLSAIHGVVHSVEQMRAEGWQLVRKDFTQDGRHGVDLVFTKLDPSGASQFATVEAKGFSKSSHLFRPTPHGDMPGDQAYTARVLQESVQAGNLHAKRLLKDIGAGKVIHITQFLDGRIVW